MIEAIHLLSAGLGVQSSTLALMAAAGEIGPMPQAGIFADTKAEPQEIYRWRDWLESKLPFPLVTVTAGSLVDHALKMRTTRDGRSFTVTSLPYFTRSASNTLGKVPHRTCTADFKIKPIIKEARRRVGHDSFVAWRRKHRAALKEIAAFKKSKGKKTVDGLEIGCAPFPSEAWRGRLTADTDHRQNRDAGAIILTANAFGFRRPASSRKKTFSLNSQINRKNETRAT